MIIFLRNGAGSVCHMVEFGNLKFNGTMIDKCDPNKVEAVLTELLN